MPFLPTEQEIDVLIASCGKITATVLQMLKETGMRIGELCRLKWTDLEKLTMHVCKWTEICGFSQKFMRKLGKIDILKPTKRKARFENEGHSCL